MKATWLAAIAFLALCAWNAAAQKHTLFVPHFTFKDELWQTEIGLNHTGDELQEVVVAVYDNDGTKQAIVTWEILPQQGIHGDLETMLAPLNADVGWLEITTGAAPVQGLVKFSHVVNGGSSSLPAVSDPSTELVFSLLEHTAQWDSGFAMVNTSDQDAQVAMDLYGFDGSLIESKTEILRAKAKRVAMLDDVFDAVLPAAAFLECRSDQPLVGLALTFAQGLDQIVAVPAALSAQAVTDRRTKFRQLVELTTGNNALAIDMFHALRPESENLFYSPHSISTALAMAFAGARNQTARAMADCLHFSLAPSALHQAFFNLNQTLGERGQGAAGRDGEGFRLHITQSLWGQIGYPFLPEFIDLLHLYYDAQAQWLDFSSNPDEARTTINDWVAEETEDRIEDLLPPGSIDALTRLVLVNTIYFNAAWAFPFPEEATHEAPFFLQDGNTVDVELMVLNPVQLDYVETETYQAVEIPYDGDEIAMTIVVPQEGAFDSFENNLTLSTLAQITRSLNPTDVVVELPKFEYASDSVSLKNVLADLGMAIAFGGSADFSGIDGGLNLFISDVIHKTFLAIDEAGTEAAAATGVVFRETAAPNPERVRVDRPFIFWIQDLDTGAILFFGRILNPAS